MLVPSLPKDKDLIFCQHTLMVFLERLFFFEQYVEQSPPLKVTGIESDIVKLQDVAKKMIEKIDKMREMMK